MMNSIFKIGNNTKIQNLYRKPNIPLIENIMGK